VLKDVKNAVKIMEIPFYNGTKKQFMSTVVEDSFQKKTKQFIVTANPEIVMATKNNEPYKQIVQSATNIVPDGIGILLAAKRKKTPLQERIAGFDLFMDMLVYANENNATCYFLGATEETNKKAVENIQKQYPNIRILGRHHGYISLDDKELAEEISTLQPDFIFVALGFPKQEEWIDSYSNLFQKGIFIGLGGSFDVLAGNVKRAPEIWIKLRLEWFYRIALQPTRWKRLVPLAKFLGLTIIRKI